MEKMRIPVAPLLADVAKMRAKIKSDAEVMERMRLNQVKLEEQLTAEIEENKNKDATIEQLREEIEELNQKLQTAGAAKRKRMSSSKQSIESGDSPQVAQTTSTISLLPQTDKSVTPTISFSSKLLHEMKYEILHDARLGINVIAENEVIIISKAETYDKVSRDMVAYDGESVLINTNTYEVKPLTSPDAFIDSAISGDAEGFTEFFTVSNNNIIQKWKNGCIVKTVQLHFEADVYDDNEIVDKNPALLEMIPYECGTKHIIVAARGRISLIDGESLECESQWESDDASSGFTAICTNGQYLAAGHENGFVEYVDLRPDYIEEYEEDEDIYLFTYWASATAKVNSLAMDDGAIMASASNDHCVRVWDMEADKELFRLKHDAAVNYVEIHGELVVSSSDDMTVRIWNKSTGQLQHSLAHKYGCGNFDISPNGKFIAVANGDSWTYGLTVWSVTGNYEKLAKLELGDVRDVYFPTDDMIIAGCRDGKVFLLTKN